MIVRKKLDWNIIFQIFWKRLVGLIVVSVLVSFIYHQLGWDKIAVPNVPASIFGIGLSIVMAFKMRAAYERWYEARNMWGGVLNNTRSLARQIMTFPSPDGEEVSALQRQMMLRQIAFAYALKNHLRKTDIWAEIEPFLSPGEIAQLRTQQNIPNALMDNQAKDIARLHRMNALTDIQQAQIDSKLNVITDSFGACEKIKNTVFPRQYDEFCTLFVTLFSYLLPVFLVAGGYFSTIIGTVLIGFFFFTIDGVANNIMNPFENSINDTPMGSMCRTIEINLKQSLDHSLPVPEPLQPVNGFLY